jgi:serine protease Do
MGTEMREMVTWARSRKVLASALIAVTLVVGILIGTVISDRAGAGTGATRAVPVSDAAPLAVPSPVQLSSTFATITKQVEPAMVNISTVQVREPRRSLRTPRGQQQQPREFFEFPFDQFFGPQEEGPQAERSLGSGVIVDKRGYILTNNHVVAQATKIQVRLDDDQKRYTARVIGTDELTDLAVIKIEAERDLPVAKLGNSDAVQVGDWVLAFGSPFGLQATVTAGIVSAKDRNAVGGQFQRFIQTDAAINPGNSGGPLVNMAAEVIGINTAIYTQTRGYDGVGFALPSNVAVSVYNQLIKAGRVVRGSIGVRFQEDRSQNPATLQALGTPHGMVLEDVTPNSPADKAGLQPGDVITHINGKVVRTGNDLVDPIAETAIGGQVKLKYMRDRKALETTVTVEDRSKVFSEEEGNREEKPDEETPTQMGLRVEDLTPEQARRVGLEGRDGALVTLVEPATFAEDVQFLRGDLIVEVNGAPVRSATEFRTAVGKLKKGQNVVFKVLRRDRQAQRTLTVFLSGQFQE